MCGKSRSLACKIDADKPRLRKKLKSRSQPRSEGRNRSSTGNLVSRSSKSSPLSRSGPQGFVLPGLEFERGPDPPKFLLIRKNRYGDASLRRNPMFSGDEDRCRCQHECSWDCLNASLYVECNAANCVFCENTDGRCHNRLFSSARDEPVGVFWMGEKGYGLRVTRDVEAGELVVEYVGEVKPFRELKSWRYTMLLNRQCELAIDASKYGGLGRFLNHSCKPNCTAQVWVVDGENRVGIIAMVPILCGEECTYSYSSETLEKCYGEAPQLCLCGEPCCSGFIGVSPKAVRSSMRVPETKHRKVDKVPESI